MKKHELMDKLEDLQVEAWNENTGSNEADLDYREKVYTLIEGLLKNNGVLKKDFSLHKQMVLLSMLEQSKP